MLLHDVTQKIVSRSEELLTECATNDGFPPVLPSMKTRQYGARQTRPQDADAESFGDPKRLEETQS
jgi:hypothetical protein